MRKQLKDSKNVAYFRIILKYSQMMITVQLKSQMKLIQQLVTALLNACPKTDLEDYHEINETSVRAVTAQQPSVSEEQETNRAITRSAQASSATKKQKAKKTNKSMRGQAKRKGQDQQQSTSQEIQLLIGTEQEKEKDVAQVIELLSPTPHLEAKQPRPRKAEKAAPPTSSPYKAMLDAKKKTKVNQQNKRKQTLKSSS